MTGALPRLLVIARREYFSYLKTPGFWLSLLVAPIFAALAATAPAMMERSAPPPAVAVVDFSQPPVAAAPPRPRALAREEGSAVVASVRRALKNGGPRLVDAPPEVWRAGDPAAAGRALRPWLTGDRRLTGGTRLDAAAIVTGTPGTLAIDWWSRNLSDRTTEAAVREAVAGHMRAARLHAAGLDPAVVRDIDRAQPAVRDFTPTSAAAAGSGGEVSLRDRMPGIAGFGLAFMLWGLIMTGAGMLLNSVIEEKANRVLEVLLSSADTAEILGGKILGVAALSGTVMLSWGALALAGVAHFAPDVVGQLAASLFSGGLIVWFLLYFVFGYLMYASLFAAIGSFCETSREAQTLLGPVMIFLTLPMVFLSLAIRRPDSPMIQALSWFPPFTPFLMTARASSGPPLIEMLGTLALVAGVAVGVVWLSARAFRAGALSTVKLDPRAGLVALFRAARTPKPA